MAMTLRNSSRRSGFTYRLTLTQNFLGVVSLAPAASTVLNVCVCLCVCGRGEEDEGYEERKEEVGGWESAIEMLQLEIGVRE